MSTRKTTVWRLVAAASASMAFGALSYAVFPIVYPECMRDVAAGAACGSAAARMWASWALFTGAAGFAAFRFLKVTNERSR